MAIFIRQVCLQHLPTDEVPECGPGLNYWISYLPVIDGAQKVHRGSAECAKVDWTFLRLSISEMTLVFFWVFTLFIGVEMLDFLVSMFVLMLITFWLIVTQRAQNGICHGHLFVSPCLTDGTG